MRGFSQVVCSSPNGRGIHRYALGICRANEHCVLLTPSPRSKKVFWELVYVPFKINIRAKHIDILFCNSRISPFIWRVGKETRLWIVIHDLMDTSLDKQKIDREKGIFRLIRDYVVGHVNGHWIWYSTCKSHGVLANSAYTKELIVQHMLVGPEKIVVIYPEPTFNDLAMVSQRETTVRYNRMNIVLAVTGVSDNKAHLEYFELAQQLSAMVDSKFKMIIVGITEDDLKRDVQCWLRDNRDIIEVRKGISDASLFRLYLRSSVFISLSRNEGFGIPVDDALGFGIDVFARDIPAYRELRWLHSKKNLFLYQSLEDMASQLEKYFCAENINSIDEMVRTRAYLNHCVERAEVNRSSFKHSGL